LYSFYFSEQAVKGLMLFADANRAFRQFLRERFGDYQRSLESAVVRHSHCRNQINRERALPIITADKGVVAVGYPVFGCLQSVFNVADNQPILTLNRYLRGGGYDPDQREIVKAHFFFYLLFKRLCLEVASRRQTQIASKHPGYSDQLGLLFLEVALLNSAGVIDNLSCGFAKPAVDAAV